MIKNGGNKSYLWIVGGGLLQVPLISEARKLSLKVIVSDGNPACPCGKLADIFFAIDIFDIQKHLLAAFKLRSQGIKIDGVLVAGIDCTVTAAVLARAIGLPGVDPLAAYITNNKHVFRDTLKRIGYPVPRYKAVGPVKSEEIAGIIKEIGFPLIVKNTDSSGSRGTRIFYNEAPLGEIAWALQDAQQVSRSKIALLEELWEGREYTVETLFDVKGKFHPCFITDRIFDRRNGYPLELGLRNPTSLGNDTQRKMYSLVKRVASGLGINIGAAKADIILTDKGPRILEMTTRLSGGFDCQYLVPHATGKNIMRAAMLTALGREFPLDLLKDKKKRIGLTASLWPEPGRIVSVDGVEEARRIRGCEEIFFRYKVGDSVQPYVDCTKRVCFIIVTGKDEGCAQKTLEQVKRTIKIKTVKEGVLK